MAVRAYDLSFCDAEAWGSRQLECLRVAQLKVEMASFPPPKRQVNAPRHSDRGLRLSAQQAGVPGPVLLLFGVVKSTFAPLKWWRTRTGQGGGL